MTMVRMAMIQICLYLMMSELSPEGAGDRRLMGNRDDNGGNMRMIQSTANRIFI